MQTLLSPPILFFVLGILATLFHTGLRIPHPIPKLLSLYLLFSIGFRGGVELNHSGITAQAAGALGVSILLACIVPLYSYALLRRRMSAANAGAVAATYGSISAVTFITASAVLEQQSIAYSGYMVAAMALMESPAIVIGVLLVRLSREQVSPDLFPAGRATLGTIQWGKLLHESFLNGPVFLLLGSMAVGIITGDRGETLLRPFYSDIFTGALCFFLLDLGLLAARRLRDLRDVGWFAIAFAIVTPVVNAMLGLVAARLLGLGHGDAFLLMLLSGSASYIAAPAALRLIIPEANPSIYVPMALGITFPLNVAIGIPVYLELTRLMWAP
jgi:uncharacterized protein